MALWLVRAGKYGEHEPRFFEDGRAYLTWGGTEDADLSLAKDYDGIKLLFAAMYADEKLKTRINWASQVAPFVFTIKVGDWVVVPGKHTPALAFGVVEKIYAYNPKADESYRHSLKVKWLNTEVPRTTFDQDLLYSFGAFMTVCQITRNNAEARVRAMAADNWKSRSVVRPIVPADGGDDPSVAIDVERFTRDQVTHLIGTRFKGHRMAALVEAVLVAQGFQTHLSPPGPDQGLDILASSGVLGFAEPRICVQVKSQDTPCERAVLDALGGVMKKVNATHGLLVCWGGFKSSIDKEAAQQFFHVRLWDADDLIDAMLAVYDKLDADLRADLPLKRIWVLADVGAAQ